MKVYIVEGVYFNEDGEIDDIDRLYVGPNKAVALNTTAKEYEKVTLEVWIEKSLIEVKESVNGRPFSTTFNMKDEIQKNIDKISAELLAEQEKLTNIIKLEENE